MGQRLFFIPLLEVGQVRPQFAGKASNVKIKAMLWGKNLALASIILQFVRRAVSFFSKTIVFFFVIEKKVGHTNPIE
jgi:hypothetical protein